jgi:two-component system, NtrC family, response regulator GlrR
MKPPKILLLDFDSDRGLTDALGAILESSTHLGLQVRRESVISYGPNSPKVDFPKLVSAFYPDVVFIVLCGDSVRRAGTLLQSLRAERPELPILCAIEANGQDEMFELFKLGVDDFITPPFKPIEIFPRIWRLLGNCSSERRLTHSLKEKFGLKQLIGESPVFLAEVKKIPIVARCDASVLISGETGTGKELVARAIHYLSPRTAEPFVPVNCGAIPLDLTENELFGHVKGAFTAASTSQPGLIQEANGGTFFLDEIDCLPLLAQVKLLRFLQTKEYRPLGSKKMQRADVRLIAAANVDFDEAVRTGKLRQDFYYRLNVISLHLPPLRERREDIPVLACHFLAKYTAEFNQPALNFSADALELLQRYDWPGNVRELEHLIARTVVLAEREIIKSDELSLPRRPMAAWPASFREAKARFERAYVEDLLLAHHGNITKAAQAAHKNRRAFWELIRRHHIDVNCFKADINSALAAK